MSINAHQYQFHIQLIQLNEHLINQIKFASRFYYRRKTKSLCSAGDS